MSISMKRGMHSVATDSSSAARSDVLERRRAAAVTAAVACCDALPALARVMLALLRRCHGILNGP
eukprot:3150245-Prymnesium_polylepis.1